MVDDRTIQDEIAQKKKAMNEDARRLAQDNAKKASLVARRHLEELRQAAIAEEIEALKKKAVVGTDKEGRQITKQSVFEDKLKQVMSSEQSSIHDWKSSMMALISVLSAFVEAVNQDINEKTAPVIVSLKHALKNGIIDMKDTLLDKLRGDPRINLPTLAHHVSIGADNKLAVKLRAGEEEMHSQDRAALVARWLDERGLERDPDHMDGFRTKNGHMPISADAFNKLKDDPQNGLDAFLNRASVKLPQGLRTLVALWLNERGYEIDPNNPEGFISKEGHEPLTTEQFNQLKNNPDHGLNEFLNRASEVQYAEELDNNPRPN
ncbi:hypothetical protein [Legionella saoudiensis]|uniref:hypothetical protein n=1 Tax=Legionella saoudiensis TaxID=1750561 RepID=UPI000730C725|nr:hypothetical protein [Legionella saoudiensis]